MAKAQSEYDVEVRFIDRLGDIGYNYIEMHDYADVIDNFRTQLIKLNADNTDSY